MGPVHFESSPALQERSLLLLLDFSGQANEVRQQQSEDVEKGPIDPRSASGEEKHNVNSISDVLIDAIHWLVC